MPKIIKEKVFITNQVFTSLLDKAVCENECLEELGFSCEFKVYRLDLYNHNGETVIDQFGYTSGNDWIDVKPTHEQRILAKNFLDKKHAQILNKRRIEEEHTHDLEPLQVHGLYGCGY